MTRTLRPGFDRIVRTALLGVQFRDVLDGRVVSADLRVDLLDVWRPDKPLRLQAGRSGVFAVHALPGMSGFDAPDLISPVITVENRFSLSVHDVAGRYVDTRVALTVPSRGLFVPHCLEESPGTAPPHVPLYSAPTRPLPGALAVVRASLRLASDEEQPARWARLELWLGSSRLAAGVADAEGGVLLLAPLPAPREPARRASPPAGFERMAWDVSLRAYWNAAHRTVDVPDLCAVHDQPEVGLLDARGAAAPLATLTLRAVEPLIAASRDSSYLLVSA